MRDTLASTFQAINVAIGLAVFLGIMWWALSLHVHQWRRVAGRYAGIPNSSPVATKLETIVIAEPGVSWPYSANNKRQRVYAGIRLSIHPDGISARPIALFNFRSPALFLPFVDMEFRPTRWALWPEPWAILMRELPDLEIIVDGKTLAWIRQHKN